MVEKTKQTTAFACPLCDSENVAVTEEQMLMINTGDHYCNSVEARDPNAKATCLDCRWQDQRALLIQHFHESKQ